MNSGEMITRAGTKGIMTNINRIIDNIELGIEKIDASFITIENNISSLSTTINAITINDNISTLSTEIRTTIDASFNNVNIDIATLNTTVDASFLSLNTDIATLNTTVDASFNNVNIDIATLNTIVDASFNNVNIDIATLNTTVDASFNSLINVIDESFNNVNTELGNIITDGLASVRSDIDASFTAFDTRNNNTITNLTNAIDISFTAIGNEINIISNYIGAIDITNLTTEVASYTSGLNDIKDTIGFITETTFDTLVLRRPSLFTGTQGYAINFQEIQLWIGNINILYENGITPTSRTISGYFKGETEFVNWTNKALTSSYNNEKHASNAHNNVFFDYDVHTGTDGSTIAIIIALRNSFKVNDIQSIVLYGRPSFEQRALGLAFELYDRVKDPYFNNPIIQTPEIRATNDINVRFDFPAFSTYTNSLANSNSTTLIRASSLVYNITNISSSFPTISETLETIMTLTGPTAGTTVNTAYKIYDKFITTNIGNWIPIDNNIDTGFVASFIPTSSNSKILIQCTLHVSCSTTTDSRWWGAKLYRKIGSSNWEEVVGATNNNTVNRPSGTGCFMASHHQANVAQFIQNLSNSYVDDAIDNTNMHYYTIYWKCRIGANDNGKVIHLNRADSSNDAFRSLPVSSIIIQEIYYP